MPLQAPKIARASVVLATLLSSCGRDPTGLNIEVLTDGAVRRLELSSFLEDGSPAFPKTVTDLPEGTAHGNLVVLVKDAFGGHTLVLRLEGFADDGGFRGAAAMSAKITRNSLTQVDVALEASVAGCGDGQLSIGEGCDDANSKDGDGCSSRCQPEPGWVCSGSPCRKTCGDGVVVAPESCDDGNVENGDGCSSACQVEAGWDCTGSTCNPACGDGLSVGSEACDDGDVQNGDGCSSTCEVELGWSCAPDGCTRVCTGAAADRCADIDTRFGLGFGDVRWGMSPEEVQNRIGMPYYDVQWDHLPTPGEYGAANIRYAVRDLLRPLTELTPMTLVGGQLVLFYKDGRLFRASIRFDERNPNAVEEVRRAAERQGLPLTTELAGTYFMVKTAQVLYFGATGSSSGCYSRGPCLELIQVGSPTWNEQRFR